MVKKSAMLTPIINTNLKEQHQMAREIFGTTLIPPTKLPLSQPCLSRMVGEWVVLKSDETKCAWSQS